MYNVFGQFRSRHTGYVSLLPGPECQAHLTQDCTVESTTTRTREGQIVHLCAYCARRLDREASR